MKRKHCGIPLFSQHYQLSLFEPGILKWKEALHLLERKFTAVEFFRRFGAQSPARPPLATIEI
jgi:hypothetical protein